MQLYLKPEPLADYIAKQLFNSFPVGDSHEQVRAEIWRGLPQALERVEYCFSRSKAKYFQKDGEAFFSPLMTDQYAMFLYFLANTIYNETANVGLADRLYALNKMLHGIDVFYQVELPKVFLFVHSVGTVLGRAKYGEGLVVYQGVTVGGNMKLDYPSIGKGVALFSNCSVIGAAVLGDDVAVSARSVILNDVIPAGQVCFGQHPNVQCKKSKSNIQERFFSDF